MLRLRRADDQSIHVELLRSHDWIEDCGAHVGGSVFLDMPEMGICGQAEVFAIEPCPPLEEGEGRLVTGTFKHTPGEVYDLKLASESKSVGVTATHPFWSVDRNAWVSAIDLEIGETLKTLAGTTVVESRSEREEPETVYNIEVEGDHVYRVGESGVLVNNTSLHYQHIDGTPKKLTNCGEAEDKITWTLNSPPSPPTGAIFQKVKMKNSFVADTGAINDTLEYYDVWDVTSAGVIHPGTSYNDRFPHHPQSGQGSGENGRLPGGQGITKATILDAIASGFLEKCDKLECFRHAIPS